MSTDKKIVLVTGGNTGLGYEIIKALYASPHAYALIIGTRTVSNGDAAITKLQSEVPTPGGASTLSVVQIDIASDQSIEAAVASIASSHGRIDSLINNAGANFDTDVRDGKVGLREGFNASWDVNVSGTHVLTTHAIPLLLKSTDARLMFLTSGTSSIAETMPENWGNMYMLPRINASPPAGWPKPPPMHPLTTYRSTKAGLNMLMREWARILKEDGIKVWAVSPGFLATGLAGTGVDVLRKMGALEPHVGGEFVRDVVEGKYDSQAGLVIRAEQPQPW
ncbi:hypothetical protein HMN09_00263900 [Mycena chlorophos]|uniref:NAD(P)-binding protein n=1 Tax=Mycena chlorophos TaxID=658473 RepID=A0A8H6TLG5_MYCCL|nr:hypothetical protein HMN09_00263900 [Mycena chlorophos]